MRKLRQASTALRGVEDSAARYARLALIGASSAATIALVPSPLRCYYQQEPDGSVDRLQRWSKRSWGIKKGANPGFHVRTVNPWLETYLPRLTEGLDLPEGAAPSVLVPLCGKSIDMPFLCEQGLSVLGVEGVLRPLVEFRSEHRMRLKEFKKRNVISHGPDGWFDGVYFIPAKEFQGAKRGYAFKLDAEGLGYYRDSPAIWRGKVRATGNRTLPLEVLQGDMFDVTPELIKAASFETRGVFDVIYDRGGLDSVPLDAREEYIATLSRLLRPGGRLLLVTVDYDQAQVPVDPTGRRWSPPPFSVPEAEVRRLLPAGSWDIEVLGREREEDLPVGNPSFHGVAVSEVAYLITKRRSRFSASGDGSQGSRIFTPGVVALAGVGVVGAAVAMALRRSD